MVEIAPEPPENVTSQVDEASPGVREKGQRRFPFRIVDFLLALLIVAVFVSQVVMWTAWDSGWGDSLKNLITVSQFMLVLACGLLWWVLFGPIGWKTRVLTGLAVVLGLAGWTASIHHIEPTGDMLPHIVYRWEKLAEEKLREHLATVSRPEIEALESRPVPAIMPEDMPAYRGIHRDGVVIGPELSQNWQTSPPSELFRQPCGKGYSAFVVVDGLLITIEQRGEQEAIVCYDSKTGEEQWIHQYDASFFEAMGGAGPRATPVIHGDAVYSFGAFGDLCCLDLLTGTQRWHVNSLIQFDQPNNVWAMSSSPLIYEDSVIVNVGGTEGNALVAYSLAAGQIVWKGSGLPEPVQTTDFTTGTAPDKGDLNSVAGYSSPMLSMVAGQEVLLNFEGLGLRAHRPENGEELWFHPFQNDALVNVAQPIVINEDAGSARIFLSASYNVGCEMLRVSRSDEGRWTVDSLWANKNMKCKFTSPVYYEGYLYGLDEGILVCLDPESGDRMWKGSRSGLRGRYRHGQILLTNGQIVALSEQGELVLVDPSPEELKEVTWFQVLPQGKNWNPLTLAHGIVYVRNTGEMAAYNLAR